MSSNRPDPYGIDGEDRVFSRSGRFEHIGPQSETDDRARSPGLDGVPLDPGRKCARCAYDLTGLYVGGNCPECGSIILSVAPRSELAALHRFPRWYLGALSAVLGAMAVIGCIGVALGVYLWAARFGAVGVSATILVLARIASLGWFACVAAICAPPPEREPALGVGRSRAELTLAGAAAGSQLGFVACAFLTLVLTAQQMAWIPWIAAASYACVALVGFQLSKIAWRLNDEDRADRLQSAAFSIPLGYGVVLLFGRIIGAQVPLLSLFGVPFLLIQFLGIGLQIWGCAYIIWSCWSLSREADWAIRNARASEARDRRLQQRARENYEQARREHEEREPFGGPLR